MDDSVNHGGVQQRRCIIITEKIDMYSLGNIMMLTERLIYIHSAIYYGDINYTFIMEDGARLQDKVQSKVLNGGLPSWPDNFNQTKLKTNPALMEILQT
jgi:hypothetical protein